MYFIVINYLIKAKLCIKYVKLNFRDQIVIKDEMRLGKDFSKTICVRGAYMIFLHEFSKALN